MDHQVELLRRVFPCATLKHYGHSERLLMAASMPGDDRYFFWPQYGHMELVDQTGKPVTEPGEMGEIVGTGYDNMVMPLIRYRTGDMAVLSGTPHPGLPGFPVVERIEGRLQEFIVCSDNRLISVNSLTNLAQDPEMEKADMIQFEQLRPGHLRMKIVAPTELSAQVRARVGRRLMTRAQGGLQLEVIQTESIPRTPRGKQQMLVQHLDMRGYFGTPDSV
jgi:phenylacetate-CoA ligase